LAQIARFVAKKEEAAKHLFTNAIAAYEGLIIPV
jgi:hypothetical protein